MKISLFSFLVVVFVLVPAASAQSYVLGHDPNSVLRLCRGFLLGNMDKTLRDGFTCDPDPPPPVRGPAKTSSLDMYYAVGSNNLKKALNVDLSVDASYLTYSGNGNYTSSNLTLLSEDSASIVLKANSEYQSVDAKNLKLTKEAEDFFQQNGSEKFERLYGSRVVTSLKKGVSVTVIITISKRSTFFKNNLAAKVSTGGGFGPFSITVGGSVSQELSQSVNSGEASVKVFSVGGTGISAMADLVRAVALSSNANSVDQVITELSKYIKQFDAKDAVDIGYNTADVSSYEPNSQPANLWNALRESGLTRITQEYRAAYKIYEIAQDILSGADDRSILLKTGVDRQNFADGVTKLQTYLNDLAVAHQNCQSKFQEISSCNLPTPIDYRSVLPKYPIPEVKISAGGTIDVFAREITRLSFSIDGAQVLHTKPRSTPALNHMSELNAAISAKVEPFLAAPMASDPDGCRAIVTHVFWFGGQENKYLSELVFWDRPSNPRGLTVFFKEGIPSGSYTDLELSKYLTEVYPAIPRGTSISKLIRCMRTGLVE